MRLLASILTGLSLAVAPVLADITYFSVPAVIQPNTPFNATYTYADEQPSQFFFVWGYTPFDYTTPHAYMPQHNTVGHPITTVPFDSS